MNIATEPIKLLLNVRDAKLQFLRAYDAERASVEYPLSERIDHMRWAQNELRDMLSYGRKNSGGTSASFGAFLRSTVKELSR